MHLHNRGFGDDNTDPDITIDDSGMSVVTVTASEGLPWYVWLAILAGGCYLWSRS